MNWTPNKIQRICKFCGKPATEKYHKFPQKDKYREIYGSLLDEGFNTEYACNGCNGSHRNVVTWDEKKFREEALKNGHDLPEGTKSYQNKEVVPWA